MRRLDDAAERACWCLGELRTQFYEVARVELLIAGSGASHVILLQSPVAVDRNGICIGAVPSGLGGILSLGFPITRFPPGLVIGVVLGILSQAAIASDFNLGRYLLAISVVAAACSGVVVVLAHLG